jgi:FSR family fosmidomycin resistance protein-like MFS transporter
MAIFISSGALGLAVGPALFSAVTGARGLDGATLAMIPGIAISVLLLVFMRDAALQARSPARFAWAPMRAVWRPMLVLYLLVFVRSTVQITFTQFLPLYLHSQRGYSVKIASYSLSVFLLGGAIGGFAGGNLADRFGGKRIILASMIGSFPFLALFLFAHGILSATGLFVGGLILLCTNPVNVVMAQELAPAQAGTVSALMMGFAWGTAGLMFIPLTGWISDVISMQVAFTGLILFPLIGFALALKLPK